VPRNAQRHHGVLFPPGLAAHYQPRPL